MVRRQVLLREGDVHALRRRAADGVGDRPTEEQLEGFRLVAKRAIEASLELADELEAA